MVYWPRAIQAACLFRGQGIWVLKEKYKKIEKRCRNDFAAFLFWKN